MNKFSELGITSEEKYFVGDKISVKRLFDKEIVVHAFRRDESKHYKDKGDGHYIQVQIEISGEKRVFFTASESLKATIAKVPADKFPFTTTIVKIDERYKFT